MTRRALGGIYNFAGTLTVSNSTLLGNSASGNGSSSFGGGIENEQWHVDGEQFHPLGNSAVEGGGIYNTASFAPPPLP